MRVFDTTVNMLSASLEEYSKTPSPLETTLDKSDKQFNDLTDAWSGVNRASLSRDLAPGLHSAGAAVRATMVSREIRSADNDE